MGHVVLTDHPWADLDIERDVIEGAGHQLIIGPVEAGSAEQVEALIAGANPVAIITCWAPVRAAAIAAPSRLAIVARMGVGLDNIDVAAASARGAWVTNVPDYCVAEVSDHALAMSLGWIRGIVQLDRDVKERGWHVPRHVPARLSELTVAVLGYGRIGRETARKFRAFGCRVLTYDKTAPATGDGVEPATLEQVQASASLIILHLPLTERTSAIIDRAFIAGCTQRPLIVNVSRGGLIDNDALAWGLDQGLVSGAALDVLDGEPTPPRALTDRADVLVTPHIAYLSDASLRELRRRACEEVVRVLAGAHPQHPCNQPVLVCGEPLRGGVSSDIHVVDGLHGPEVVKVALGKLKVAASWFSDPARSGNEVRALTVARELIGPLAVPEILWVRPEENSFAMSLVPARFRNWKESLLAGNIDLGTAQSAGRTLGMLHSASSRRLDIAAAFADRTYFQELRVEPFFERVAVRLPDLADAIRNVAAAMLQRQEALVHGDYSPKNILADGADIVVLDFEVAHWGDPRFDLGFCLSHLLLKSIRVGADTAALLGAAEALLDGYAATGLGGVEDDALSQLTACLMLARTDGASPVDYLDDDAIRTVRKTAGDLLTRPTIGIRQHIASLQQVAA